MWRIRPRNVQIHLCIPVSTVRVLGSMSLMEAYRVFRAYDLSMAVRVLGSIPGLGMRCVLGSMSLISELDSAIESLSLKNAIAISSSEMSYMLPSPRLIPRP